MQGLSKETGGPAFPLQNKDFTHAYGGAPGMTLRDYFAAQVIGHVLSGKIPDSAVNPKALAARIAYEIADAMLAERAL